MESGAARARVLEALGRVLGPVVLLLLKSGITWKEFSDLAKAKFVQVATENFGIRGRPTNASRVAILTGIDRRDVRKWREAVQHEGTPDPGFMSKPTQVLDGWYHDPEFCTQGGPRDLPLKGDHGSFEALVRRYAPGIPPVAMVKELRAAATIRPVGRQKLRAIKRTYIPRELGDNQVRLWGSVLQDVGATLEHNLMRTASQPPRFERRAINLKIDRKAVPEFEAFLAREGQEFLERVDDWLARHQLEAGPAADGATVRLGAGVYQIADHTQPSRGRPASGPARAM